MNREDLEREASEYAFVLGRTNKTPIPFRDYLLGILRGIEIGWEAARGTCNGINSEGFMEMHSPYETVQEFIATLEEKNENP